MVLSANAPLRVLARDHMHGFASAVLVPLFFAQKGYKNLTQWTDAANALPPTYGATALPLTVLYGRGGKEIWRVMGGFDWSSDTARKAVAEATG